MNLRTFARDDVPAIMDLAQQTTVYMSQRDGPLGISGWLSGGSRIGRPDFADLEDKDIEQLAADPRLNGIDVADVPGAHKMGGSRGHGYWYANDRISTDVILSLRYPLPPEKRCLIRDEQYRKRWRLPADYPDCVVNSLLKVFPELRRATAP